ncbi:MAG: hypothetical protein GF347_02295 [Candidatus Moranbacteria bacterium]|nr:hypothetical protein [Candidatus Moranbacteria bacterium]
MIKEGGSNNISTDTGNFEFKGLENENGATDTETVESIEFKSEPAEKSSGVPQAFAAITADLRKMMPEGKKPDFSGNKEAEPALLTDQGPVFETEASGEVFEKRSEFSEDFKQMIKNTLARESRFSGKFRKAVMGTTAFVLITMSPAGVELMKNFAQAQSWERDTDREVGRIGDQLKTVEEALETFRDLKQVVGIGESKKEKRHADKAVKYANQAAQGFDELVRILNGPARNKLERAERKLAGIERAAERARDSANEAAEDKEGLLSLRNKRNTRAEEAADRAEGYAVKGHNYLVSYQDGFDTKGNYVGRPSGSDERLNRRLERRRDREVDSNWRKIGKFNERYNDLGGLDLRVTRLGNEMGALSSEFNNTRERSEKIQIVNSFYDKLDELYRIHKEAVEILGDIDSFQRREESYLTQDQKDNLVKIKGFIRYYTAKFRSVYDPNLSRYNSMYDELSR